MQSSDGVMARDKITAKVKQVRKLLESLGPPVAVRKLYGVLNALEMQVEDGRYQRHAVARLCEALLATAEIYDIPEESASALEELVCDVVGLVER